MFFFDHPSVPPTICLVSVSSPNGGYVLKVASSESFSTMLNYKRIGLYHRNMWLYRTSSQYMEVSIESLLGSQAGRTSIPLPWNLRIAADCCGHFFMDPLTSFEAIHESSNWFPWIWNKMKQAMHKSHGDLLNLSESLFLLEMVSVCVDGVFAMLGMAGSISAHPMDFLGSWTQHQDVHLTKDLRRCHPIFA